MTKKDLVIEILNKEDNGNISQNQAEVIVTQVFEEITNQLSAGNEVVIAGFGKFTFSERTAREGINPKTKEKIQIPASKSVKFKPGKQLKEAIN